MYALDGISNACNRLLAKRVRPVIASGAVVGPVSERLLASRLAIGWEANSNCDIADRWKETNHRDGGANPR